jgi:hypothetical protein
MNSKVGTGDARGRLRNRHFRNRFASLKAVVIYHGSTPVGLRLLLRSVSPALLSCRPFVSGDV